MHLLENDKIRLRALEAEDLDLLFTVENNPQFWEVSNTLTPYSRQLLEKYLENSHQDIYEAKQLRLVISGIDNNDTFGLIDLFDFNPYHNRAGIGILILQNYQHNGYASSALELFLRYTFDHLDMHQLYANIPVSNTNSLKLFEKLNFVNIGIQKDWIKVKGKYQNVALLQIINPNHL